MSEVEYEVVWDGSGSLSGEWPDGEVSSLNDGGADVNRRFCADLRPLRRPAGGSELRREWSAVPFVRVQECPVTACLLAVMKQQYIDAFRAEQTRA